MDIVLDGGLEKMWNEDFQLTKNIQKSMEGIFLHGIDDNIDNFNDNNVDNLEEDND
ncbi:263_t:CDS:2 [Entrophospora sp. SA101]|nr:263_t:CDS:2 [Entrophospora sp. SA101]